MSRLTDLTFSVLRQKRAERSALDEARLRLLFVGLAVFLGYSMLAFRLGELGLSMDISSIQHTHKFQGYTPKRANILDARGDLIATNLVTASVFANPKKILNIDEAANKLPTILPHLRAADLRVKLADTSKSFIWLGRNITPAQQAQILSLGLPGVDFLHEEKRVYPHGSTAAHVLGFTGQDNEGLAGLELTQDTQLQNPQGTLQLTLDMRVQSIVEEELAAAVTKFKAKGANAIIMNAHTGEIISMAAVPTFNPNSPGKVKPATLFNPNTLGVYDLGSIFKIFTAAMALDSKTLKITDGYDTSQPVKVARFSIGDYRGGEKRWLSLPEIILYSSNIGAAKMALETGAQKQQDFFRRLGFLDKAILEVPELGAPIVPAVWKEATTITISYGYGLGVSPLHVVRGMATLVNGGFMVEPTLLKNEGRAIVKEQVISAKTSKDIRRLLYLVTKEGTAKKAHVDGLYVGAKTGTAEKRKTGGPGFLKDSNLTSILAAFPIYDPKYVLLVMLDDPKGLPETFNFRAGGWNAAPTAGKIIKRIASLLNVLPRDENDPTIARELALELPPRPQIHAASITNGAV